MPTNRTRRKKGRLSNTVIPTGALEQLVKGWPPYFHPELSESELEVYYKRDPDFFLSIVGVDIRKMIDPEFCFRGVVIPFGSRPWCWWNWTAPETRRILAGDPSAALLEHGYSFGRPNCWKSLFMFNPVKFETQADYLKRHGLLMENEEQKIKPELIRI